MIYILSGLFVLVIKVNLIFDDKEIKLIGQWLFMYVNISVQFYIKEDLIFLNYSVFMKEDVIQFLCEKVVEKCYVLENFYVFVMERENMFLIVVGNLVVILYLMQLLSEEIFLMFCIFEKVVDWGDKKV